MPTRYLRLGPREQDTGSDDTSRRTEQDEEEFWPKLDKKTADRIGILNRWIYPVCRSVVTPASDISPSPLCDLVKVHADPRSDGTNSHTLGCQLYDSRSLCQPLRGALGAYQLLQLLFFSGTQHELSTLLGHLNIQARSRQDVTII